MSKQCVQHEKEGLGDILMHEYHLLRVLEYLADSGLHECRLVCKDWCEVCRKVPVKLANVPQEKLPTVVDMFPNATALHSRVRTAGGGKETCNSTRIQTNFLDEEVLKHTALLKNLTCLDLKSSGQSQWTFSEALESRMISMARLQKLSLSIECKENAYVDLFTHLRHLTSLTDLEMHLAGSHGIQTEPITELKLIRRLKVTNLLTLQNGELLFPSLQYLTHLSYWESHATLARFKGGIPEMILPYAPSLKSLEIEAQCYQCWMNYTPNDWSLLRACRQLESLECGMVSNQEMDDFCRALRDMPLLTHFAGVNVRPVSTVLCNAICSLSKLKSLNLYGPPNHREVDLICSKLTHLTSIVLEKLEDCSPLRYLTGLEKLEMTIKNVNAEDLIMALQAMPNLGALKLNLSNSIVPSNTFAGMMKLKSLDLTYAVLDEAFFPTLAELPLLMRLRLFTCTGIEPPLFQGIIQLNRLQKLEFDFPQWKNVFTTISKGDLSSLRYLDFTYVCHAQYGEKIEDQIYSVLPELRRVETA